MLKELMKPKFKGHIIELNLSQWGYKDYIVECAYHFNKREKQYSLSMWLNRIDMEDRMRLSSKEIDTQYINGTKETIVENICRIVHQAATAADKNGKKYFDRFIERYEYELACFERGNELFEKEMVSDYYKPQQISQTLRYCMRTGKLPNEDIPKTPMKQ